MIKDPDSQFKSIAEASTGEEMANPGCRKLVPANALQIPGGDSKQLVEFPNLG